MSLVQDLIRASEHLDNCFTLADLDAPDQIAVYANQRFQMLVGYQLDEIIGRNFRFLQGPLSSPEARQRMRMHLAQQRAVHQDLINYTKDGRAFWNRMVLIPLEIDQHHYAFGMQLDVTEQKERSIGKKLASLSESEIPYYALSHDILDPLNAVIHLPTLARQERIHEQRLLLTKHLRNAVQRIEQYVMSLPFRP